MTAESAMWISLLLCGYGLTAFVYRPFFFSILEEKVSSGKKMSSFTDHVLWVELLLCCPLLVLENSSLCEFNI